MILYAVLVRVDPVKTVYNDYQLKFLAAVPTFVDSYSLLTPTFNHLKLTRCKSFQIVFGTSIYFSQLIIFLIH